MTKKLLVLFTASALLLIACDAANLVSQFTEEAEPTTAPSAALPPLSRFNDAERRTMELKEKVLSSYHIEVTILWQSDTPDKQEHIDKTFMLKADVAGDDAHLFYTEKSALKFGNQPPRSEEETREAYLIKGGSPRRDQGGKEYEVKAGKVIEIDLAATSIRSIVEQQLDSYLYVAAQGPLQQGSEVIDGRACDKYNVDGKSVQEASPTMGKISKRSKGTVWVDKQTGALIKTILDWQDDRAVSPDGRLAANKQSAHIDLLVTQVGKVSVQLPK